MQKHKWARGSTRDSTSDSACKNQTRGRSAEETAWIAWHRQLSPSTSLPGALDATPKRAHPAALEKIRENGDLPNAVSSDDDRESRNPLSPVADSSTSAHSTRELIRICGGHMRHLLPLHQISSFHQPDADPTVAMSASVSLDHSTIRSPLATCRNMLVDDEKDHDEQSNDELLLHDARASSACSLPQTKAAEYPPGLRAAIELAWNAAHRDSVDEVVDRQQQHRLTRALAHDCIVYFDEVAAAVRDEPEKLRTALWAGWLPIPRFSKSPFSEQLVRLIRWLNSWKAEDDRVPEPMEVFRSEEEEQRRKLLDASGDVLHSVGAFVVNDRGERQSLRQQRKEALERERAEAEEKSRQAQRGYFGRTDSDEHGSLSNLAVISGACGVGKTALVEAAASMAGYRIVEINTSMRRCPKAVEKLFAEATQTRQILLSKGAASSGMTLQREFEAIRSMVTSLTCAGPKEKHGDAESIDDDQGTQRVVTKGSPGKAVTKRTTKGKQNALTKEAFMKFFKKPVAAAPHVVEDQMPTHPEVVDVDSLSGTTAERPSVIEVDDDDGVSSMSKTVEEATPQNSLGHEVEACKTEEGVLRTRSSVGTLILIESGDVLFDDEAGFYPTLRKMAQESKFPVIVTGNHFTDAQVASQFGVGTPHALMKPPSLLFAALQLFVILVSLRRYDIRQLTTATNGQQLMEEVLDFIHDMSTKYQQQEGDIRSLIHNFQLRFMGHQSFAMIHQPCTTGMKRCRGENGYLNDTNGLLDGLPQRSARASNDDANQIDFECSVALVSMEELRNRMAVHVLTCQLQREVQHMLHNDFFDSSMCHAPVESGKELLDELADMTRILDSVFLHETDDGLNSSTVSPNIEALRQALTKLMPARIAKECKPFHHGLSASDIFEVIEFAKLIKPTSAKIPTSYASKALKANKSSPIEQ